ncbi:MAG TPA: hypothetical protein VGU71_12240 [Candidatus Dormibacteraeota bacterium]|nr:hypothetical protein [Candidatus Dormibacteraeota bacterium]
MFLAMMWRSADGSPTLAFWWVAFISTVMIAAGIWGIVAPESLRARYFNLLNKRTRRGRVQEPAETWGWKSPNQIRIGSLLAIALAGALITWVAFFAAPGVAY